VFEPLSANIIPDVELNVPAPVLPATVGCGVSPMPSQYALAE
jgi:hypothetical protein